MVLSRHREFRDFVEGHASPQVRQATRHDAAVVTTLIGDAFRDDPVFSWLIAESECRHAMVTVYFSAIVRHLYLPYGRIDMTVDASGAALCLPAGVSAGGLPVLTELGLAWRFSKASGVRGLLRAQALQATLRANRPAQPHLYLHALGVRASQRGRGVGSALLREITDRCDHGQVRAYLENTNERNLPLYERYGFRILRERHIPGGGPPIWFMGRDLRPAATLPP